MATRYLFSAIAHCLMPIALVTPSFPALAQPAEIEPGKAIRDHIVPLRTADPAAPLDDLAPLRGIIGDARIVGLGEPTHGTREAFQTKHRLIRFLVDEMNFSIFSIEANMPEAFALNDYVIEGRGDPGELIRGMYFWTWQTEEVLALVEWMRSWNEANPPSTGRPRLRFTGFDMQTPHVAWQNTFDFLKAHAPDLAESNANLLTQIETLMQAARPGAVRDPAFDVESVTRAAAALHQTLIERRAELSEKAGAEAVGWAIQNARVVTQAVALYAAVIADPSSMFNTRDGSMAENVEWLAQAFPGERIVLWAHNGHVSRAEFMGMRPMGMNLAKAFGSDYLAVGFSTSGGTYTAMTSGDWKVTQGNPLVPPPDRSIEQVFSDAGVPMGILDIRDAARFPWSREPRPMRSIGAMVTEQQFYDCLVGDMFDIVVHIEETSSSVPLTP